MSPLLDTSLPPERIEEALNAAGIGVWEMDLPGNRFSCSARCKHLFGLPEASPVTLDHILTAAHPADRQLLDDSLARALRPDTDGRLAVEHRVLMPDGQVRWVHSTGLALFDEHRTRPVRFQGITKDITAARARGQQQDAHRLEFEMMAESVPGMLWMAQPDGAVSYFNQRWIEYTGQTMEQALSWGWEVVVHPDDLPRCLQHWLASRRTSEPYEVEYRFRRHDGHYRWFLGRALPLHDATGQLVKWVGTCTDIHAHKQTEHALRQREDELERAYHGLEEKIVFRTLALEQQIQQLQQQIRQLTASS
jgi:PAS domain S-box-containing protein